jgi:hypothetical protein
MHGLELLAAGFVSGPMPPLPTISLTPVCSMNWRSNFSMRMLVVGPMETISNLPSSFLRTMGPA